MTRASRARARARARVLAGPGSPDSAVRIAVAQVAGSRRGQLLVAAWAFAEALSWPLLPEVILAVLCVAEPKAGPRLAATAALGSLAGGATGYLLAAWGIELPQPLTTVRMRETVAAEIAAHGPAAVRAQSLNGIPYKVYAAAIGERRAGLAPFIVASARARCPRILGAGLIMTIAAARTSRHRRFYPAYLLVVIVVAARGLAAVLASWS